LTLNNCTISAVVSPVAGNRNDDEDWLSADNVDAGSFQRQQHGCAGNEPGTGAAKHQRRIPLQVSSSICMVQINLQHCRAAALVLCKQLSEYDTVIALVQEPWIRKKKILDSNTKGINLFRGCLSDHPRTCVLIKGLNALDLPQFGTKDVTAVRIDYKKVVASVYLPIDTTPPTKELEQLVSHCESKNLPLVIACDSITVTTQRGVVLSVMLVAYDCWNTWPLLAWKLPTSELNQLL